MNRVSRRVSAIDRAECSDYLGTASPSRTWPISYRSIEVLSVSADAILILFACILSGVVYHSVIEGQPGDVLEYVGTAAVVSALFCSAMKIRGLYSPAELLHFKAQLRGLALAWVTVFLFLAGVVFALKIGKEFSRGAYLSFAAFGLAILVVQRVFWHNLLTRGLAERKFSGRDIVLITAAGMTADQACARDLVSHGLRLRHHFQLPDPQSSRGRRDEIISDILSYLRGSNIQEVMVSAGLKSWPEISDLLSRLRALPLPVNLIPVGAGSELFKRSTRAIGNSVCIELHREPLGAFERATKRLMDIVCSAAGLLLLLPLLTIVALAIKLDSPGPVLFRQQRCGFNGRPFRIFKFRTMSVMEDGEVVAQAERSDGRVTRLGRWLRRTSIDELPQLLNVLNGSMSLVGPRPHALAHDSQFDKLVSNYAFRHHVKPGLTGWAQVNGVRGPTPTLADIQRRVQFDLWYIDNWSFTFDCVIILRTLIEVLRERNAF